MRPGIDGVRQSVAYSICMLVEGLGSEASIKRLEFLARDFEL